MQRDRLNEHQVLTPEERTRYSRQIMLPTCGERGQRRLKSSTVTVVGAGGLGCAVLTALVSAGVGRVVIFDFDHVSLSNLHRQPLYTHTSIGRLKVDVARESLNALNPHVEVVTFPCAILPPQQLDPSARREITESDLIIDCTDRFDARLTISRWAHALHIPHCYGAVSDAEGQVALFHPHRACFGCLFPDLPPSGVIRSCAQAGVLGVAPQVIGSLQAALAIQHLIQSEDEGSARSTHSTTTKGDAQTTLTQVSLSPLTTYQLKLSRDPHCSLCSHREDSAADDLSGYEVAQRGVIPISVRGVRAEFQRGWAPRVVDVRSRAEITRGVIDGALHLDLNALDVVEEPIISGALALEIETSLRDHILYRGDLLIYCERGPRSERAAGKLNRLRDQLKAHDQTIRGQVYELVGGYHEWANTPPR